MLRGSRHTSLLSFPRRLHADSYDRRCVLRIFTHCPTGFESASSSLSVPRTLSWGLKGTDPVYGYLFSLLLGVADASADIMEDAEYKKLEVAYGEEAEDS